MALSIVPQKMGAVEVSFQTLAENTPIGIYKTDAAGQRTYVNKLGAKLRVVPRTKPTDLDGLGPFSVMTANE